MANISLSIPVSPDVRSRPMGDKMVFGKVHQADKESARILRLVSLDRALPFQPDSRKEKLTELAHLWTESQKLLETSAHAAQAHVLDGLKKLGPRIASIYAPEFAGDDQVGAKIMRFLKDTKLVSIHPIKKSARGLKGPTFLVSYATPKGMRAYVAKYSHLNEQVSNRVYDAFARSFSDDNVCCGFTVPHSARFDFEKGLHESPSRQMVHLNPADAARIQGNFTNLAKLVVEDPQIEPNATQVMLSERVQGQNLIDFAYTNYNSLTPDQKTKFFERLGRLAMLDLMLGNTDRLVHVDDLDGTGYQLESALEVNMGNVMVSQLDNGFHLHAIDNGIDQALIDDPTARDNYTLFLKDLFQDENASHQITKNIISCFKNALSSQLDDIDLDDLKENNDDGSKVNLKDIRERLAPFLKDLREIAPQALHLGISKMASWLRKEVLPGHWEKAPEAIQLRKYLSDVYPAYYESIQERIKAFAGG